MTSSLIEHLLRAGCRSCAGLRALYQTGGMARKAGTSGDWQTSSKYMPTARWAQHHLAFTSGFVAARAVFTNSSPSGLSVRFLKVTIAIVPCVSDNATGKGLS